MEPLTALEDILARRVFPIELVDILEVLFPWLDLLGSLAESFIGAGFLFVVCGSKEGIPAGKGEGAFHF